jgi:hypothetical protein
MERVHLDVLGPLTKSNKGNTLILLIVDQFTKWVECYPLPDQSAELVAKTMVDEFFSRFGCPLEIHTDQGKNFMSNLFSNICGLLQIAKTRTTSYHPQGNGQVERVNRTLLQMIRCLRDKNIRNWDLYLPQLSGAIRATRNRSTGFTPNKLMLGREVLKPVDLVFGVPIENREHSSIHSYVKELEENIKLTHDVARENLRESVTLNKRDYDVRIRQSRYEVGDLVYVLNNQPKPGISRKLQPIYKGPLLVVNILSDVLIKVKDRRREFIVHHDRLLTCNDRFIPLWMRRLRQEVMSLDETIAYDEAERADQVNVYGDSEEPIDVSPLFEDSAQANEEATSVGTSEKTGSLPSPQVRDGSRHKHLDKTNELPLNKPTSVDNPLSEKSPPKSRRGRELKPPTKFKDYVVDNA